MKVIPEFEKVTRATIEEFLRRVHPTKDTHALFNFLKIHSRIIEHPVYGGVGKYYDLMGRTNDIPVDILNKQPVCGDIVVSFDSGCYLIIRSIDENFVVGLSAQTDSYNHCVLLPKPPVILSVSDMFYLRTSTFDMTQVCGIASDIEPHLKILGALWKKITDCKELKDKEQLNG